MHEHNKNLGIIELCVHFVFNESETIRTFVICIFHSVKHTNDLILFFSFKSHILIVLQKIQRIWKIY